MGVKKVYKKLEKLKNKLIINIEVRERKEKNKKRKEVLQGMSASTLWSSKAILEQDQGTGKRIGSMTEGVRSWPWRNYWSNPMMLRYRFPIVRIDMLGRDRSISGSWVNLCP